MIWQTILAGLTGGGFIGLIEFLIRRHDEKHDKNDAILKRLDEIEDKIGQVESKADERAAVNSRVRILRFEDELQEGRRHSKDSFDQVLSDITEYDRYCEDHPRFRNNQTATTAQHIQTVYKDRLEKHDFL